MSGREGCVPVEGDVRVEEEVELEEEPDERERVVLDAIVLVSITVFGT